MSSSGPAPFAKRNAGSGCQASGPCVWKIVCTNSGVPMTPSAIARFAVWKPGPRSVSGAEPMRTPFCAASARSSRVDSRSSPIGFSVQTCLPASTAARDTSTCTAGIVRFTTRSTSGFASTSAAVPQAPMPNSSVFDRARSGIRSPTATTATSGNDVRFSR